MSHIGVNLGFGNLHENMADEQMYAGEVAIAELADRLGFDSLWAAEHHFDDYAMCPDNVLFLAHVAGRTQRVQLGTGAVILPWNDPLRVAEKMIMLDIVVAMSPDSIVSVVALRAGLMSIPTRPVPDLKFFASSVRHYEMAGEHFATTGRYERYAETAALLRQVGLEAAAEAAASVALCGLPYEQATASLELFAKEVMPGARELQG